MSFTTEFFKNFDVHTVRHGKPSRDSLNPLVHHRFAETDGLELCIVSDDVHLTTISLLDGEEDTHLVSALADVKQYAGEAIASDFPFCQ